MGSDPGGRGDRNRERGRQMREVGIFTAIPMMLAVGPVLGYLIGHWAGGRWGNGTTWEAVGAILGLAASIRQVWLILKQHGGRR